jgi:SPP1 gp7 family putative phage head morphogenesis protein
MANFDWNDADSADLIQKVFTGDINIANLPIELYEKTANYLTQGIYDVYGIGYDQSIMMPEFETVRYLKANITTFSAAKTFQSILDIQSQLLDENGNIRSFRDFEQRAAKIESLYNKAWLRAEYRTTINQARSAKNWDRYTSQKNTFPYLRYETKDDSKVRPEHASMDGITLPVEDPFWNQYFPPNGWNCRCTITQIRKATPTKLDQIGTTNDGTPEFKDITLPDQLFRLNSGKHQVIFVDDKQKGLSHPYFKVDTRYKAYQDRNFDMPIPNDVKDLVKTSQVIAPKVNSEMLKFKPANYDQLIDYEMPDEFWRLLKAPIQLQSGVGSWHRGTKTGGIIQIDLKRYNNKLYRGKIVAHEFGHAIHVQNDLVVNRGSFAPKIDADIDVVFKKWEQKFGVGLRGEKRDLAVRFTNDIEQKSWKLRAELINNGYDKDHVGEMHGAFMDTLMALTNSRNGYGHTKTYFSGGKGYFRYAEFFAHMSENYWIGNDLFKQLLPELYDDTIELMGKLIKKI